MISLDKISKIFLTLSLDKPLKWFAPPIKLCQKIFFPLGKVVTLGHNENYNLNKFSWFLDKVVTFRHPLDKVVILDVRKIIILS